MTLQNRIRLLITTLIGGVVVTSAIAFQKAVVQPIDGKKQSTEPTYALLKFSGGESISKTGITSGRKLSYVEKDLVVLADFGKYFDKKKEILAEGNLSLDDAKQHVTADKIHVFDDPSKKLAILTGNVVIKVKPSEEKPIDPKAPVTIAPISPPNGSKPAKVESDKPVQRGKITAYCEIAEYSYKKKLLILKGHVKFVQIIEDEDGKEITRTLTAEHADYDMNAETMVIFPDPVVTDTEGRESKFTGKLFVGTKVGEETMKGEGITVRIPITEEADTPPKKQKR